jgi:hypothetical protein
MSAGYKLHRLMDSRRRHWTGRPSRSRRLHMLPTDSRRWPKRPIRWSDDPDLVLRRLHQLYDPEWWR